MLVASCTFAALRSTWRRYFSRPESGLIGGSSPSTSSSVSASVSSSVGGCIRAWHGSAQVVFLSCLHTFETSLTNPHSLEAPATVLWSVVPLRRASSLPLTLLLNSAFSTSLYPLHCLPPLLSTHCSLLLSIPSLIITLHCLLTSSHTLHC